MCVYAWGKVRTIPTNVTHTRTHWHTCTLAHTHTHTHTHSYNLDFVDFENEWEDLPVDANNADGRTADPVGALDDEGYRRWTEAQLAIIRAALAEDEAEDEDEDEDDDEYAGGGGGGGSPGTASRLGGHLWRRIAARPYAEVVCGARREQGRGAGAKSLGGNNGRASSGDGDGKGDGKGDDDVEERDMCIICISEFRDTDQCQRLPCGHLYHEVCLGAGTRHKKGGKGEGGARKGGRCAVCCIVVSLCR